MDKYEQIEVEDSLFVPFKWLDDTPGGKNLGIAEFRICLKSVRGKLTEFWVTPRQQRRNEIWHCKANEYNDFHITSYEGLGSVGAWFIFPCEEHKALSFVVAAPANSRYLEITPSSIAFWVSDYGKKPFTKIAEMVSKVGNMIGGGEDKNLIEKLLQLDEKT